MENKYYQPKIEEFHVGFEYEIFEDWDGGDEKKWWPQVYGKDVDDPERLGYVSCLWMHGHDFRVKYLDKEDIESLGWKHIYHSVDECFTIEGSFEMSSWTSYKATMHYGLYDQRMYINMEDTGAEGPNVFQGKIKNKSELKKLMEQLGIVK